ncbi:NAD(P)H-dependent flavin oxidoreductase [Sphingomonas sp.]|uniref:NAD(P)H-dependent flavin oxidoreductase n=1 Tax=Sphingomonas sp. TaxID=28214 RepID=UPI003B00DA4E
MSAAPLDRAVRFCEAYGVAAPVLAAPMAGSSPPALAAAVARGGGMGGYGALLDDGARIGRWFAAFRQASGGPVQANLWVPRAAPPPRDRAAEQSARAALAAWGPQATEEATDAAAPPNFQEQCAALIAARPTAVSSVMGLFPANFAAELRTAGIAWFATVSTPAEARAAEAAGADAVIAQGYEAGGHRGELDPDAPGEGGIGLIALVPQVADAVRIPVIAAGAIADGRGIAAALALGASAVQIGTALLLADEADTHPTWRAAIPATAPDATVVTRAYSGRAARAIGNDYVRGAPAALPYPVQRGLTAPMRRAAAERGDARVMQMWAGQGASLARVAPAADLVHLWWADARAAFGIRGE